MFKGIIRRSIERPIATSVIFIGISVAGIFAAFNLPLEIFPSVDFPRIYVTTYWPGVSPYTVESELTSPIEAELVSIKGISGIRSNSREGVSQVELQLHRDADADYVRFVVQERLSFLLDRLPAQVYPPKTSKYVPSEFMTSRFLSYRVVGALNDSQLRDIAVKRLKPVLSGIPGIAGVEVIGGRERQIQIVFDDEELQKWGIFPADIYRAVEDADIVATVGRMREADRCYSIMLHEKIASLDELRAVPVKFSGRRCIRLGDIARIVNGLSPIYSIQRINGASTVLISMKREPKTNIVRLSDHVRKTIAALQEELPGSIRLIKEDDQSAVVKTALRDLFYRVLISFIAVFLILIFFLRSARIAVLVQASIIISVLSTILVMFVSRFSLNILTIAGLALGFGFLVDNSIVVIENMDRHSADGTRGHPPEYSSTLMVVQPLVASTLTTVAALLPFLYLMDEMKAYYAPFAVTVSVALAASLLVSFSLMPAISRLMHVERAVPGTVGEQTSGARRPYRFETARKIYTTLLRFCLRHPVLVVIMVVWMFGIPFWKLPAAIGYDKSGNPFGRVAARAYNGLMGSGLMTSARPWMNHILGGSSYLFDRYVNHYDFRDWNEQTYLQCLIRLSAGSPIEETDAVTKQMESVVLGMKGLRQVRTNVSPHVAMITVFFEPAFEQTVQPVLAREKMISRAMQIGNAQIMISGYGSGFVSGGPGITMQNRLVLTGYNYAELERHVDDLVNRLAGFNRVRNIRTDIARNLASGEIFENTLKLEQGQMSTWKISSSEVISQISPYLSHYLYRQRIRIGDEEIPFAIHSEQYNNYQMYQLQDLALHNRMGQRLFLRYISSLETRPVPPVIERENQEYCRIIGFDYMASYRMTERFMEKFLGSVELPPGYSISRTDTGILNTSERRNITAVLIISVLLMYMVLAGLYESLTYPLIVFLSIPLSLIGVFIIYYLTGSTFNRSAYIGVILLFGIVLNNSILLLDRVNRLRRHGGYASFEDLLVTACLERLRPILMTTITTVGAMAPLLLLSSLSSQEDVWYTLSLSTVGGLLSSTFLGLLFLPVILQIVALIGSGYHKCLKSNS